VTGDFDDILTANRQFADDFALNGLPGVAGKGLAVVTCMDSRIDPLAILGLQVGDAKVVRNPGGRVDERAIEALVLAVHLLRADRIMVIPHTRCAMSSSTLAEVREKVGASAGQDAAWQPFGMVDDQEATLRDDVHKVQAHPLIPDTVTVGGFVYDVDTGLLNQVV
jgi:carbonic anhydrase